MNKELERRLRENARLYEKEQLLDETKRREYIRKRREAEQEKERIIRYQRKMRPLG